jgi:hypothetical protein
MKTVIVTEQDNLIDLAIAHYGNAESVIRLCIDNAVDIDTDLSSGAEASIDDSVKFQTTGAIQITDAFKPSTKSIIALEKQDIIDQVITNYGNAESVIKFCLENGIDINNDMTPGDRALIDATLKFQSTGAIILPVVEKPLNKSLIVVENQNLIDLALQEYGSVEGLVQLLNDNSIDINIGVNSGSEILIGNGKIVSKDLVALLKKQNIQIATDRTQGASPSVPLGIGYMIIESTFIVG